jgi:hypothetical protein
MAPKQDFLLEVFVAERDKDAWGDGEGFLPRHLGD